MLGVQSIHSRINALEQCIHRSNGLLTLPSSLPALEQSHSHSTTAASNTASTAAHSHSTLISKLNELTHSFHSLLSQDPSLTSYISSLSTIQSYIDQSSSSNAASVAATLPTLPHSRVTREEEIILSAQEMYTRTAGMLEQLQSLLPILDQKWTLSAAGDTDFTSLSTRLQTLESSLPRRAYLAAQQHVYFESFLHHYYELIDLCNRQFVIWNEEMERVEMALEQELKKQEQGM